jgi:acylphosphatase
MDPMDSTGESGEVPDTVREIGAQPVRVTVFVRGGVQGVGFRWWTRARALELGLVGHARNTSDGRVEVVAQGPRLAVARLVGLVTEQPSTTRRPGWVDSVSAPIEGPLRTDLTGFVER